MLQGQQVINMDQFTRFEDAQGRVFTMYCNIDRLEQHMLELAPGDAVYIRKLSKALRQFSRFNMAPDKPPELSGLADKMKMMAKILPLMGAFRRWGGLTLADLSAGFTDPLLRRAWQSWHPDFGAMAMLVTLGWLHSKVAGYVTGGSVPLATAVEKRYLGLGGSVSYKSTVAKILVENDRSVGVRLENGEEHRADYVVSAADGHATIFDLLEGKYVDDTIRGYYDSLTIFPPIVFMGLGVKRTFDDLPKLVSGLVLFLDKPLRCGSKEVGQFLVHVYNFDPTLAPAGKTVITLIIESDYDYWKSLRTDAGRYKEEKAKLAATVISILDKRFPGLAGQVEMIDVSTPVTFERYTGNWQGCYEGWLLTPKTLRLNMSKTLPGLSGFYMAGQWVSPGGGLPSGAATGRQVAQLLCKQDGKKFVTTLP